MKSQLHFYASQFQTAELNGVFYRTPTPEAVSGWKDQTGKDFVFAWKASKFITHWKRLSSNSVNSLDLLEDRLSLLGHKAGPVLFQLPPNFEPMQIVCPTFTTCFRESAATASNSGIRAGTRHRSCAFSSHANISLCISDHHDAPAPWKRTADFVYIRGHGPGGRYKGHYSRKIWRPGPGASGRGKPGL